MSSLPSSEGNRLLPEGPPPSSEGVCFPPEYLLKSFPRAIPVQSGCRCDLECTLSNYRSIFKLNKSMSTSQGFRALMFALLISFTLFKGHAESPPEVFGSFAYGGTNADAGNAMCVDPLGNIYVGGRFGKVDTQTTNSVTGNEGFFRKHDRADALQWSQLFTGTNDYTVEAITLSSGGDKIAVMGTIGAGCTTNCASSLFIAQYHSSGDLILRQDIGATGSVVGRDLVYDSEGGLLLVADFFGTVSFPTTNVVSGAATNFLVARFNAAGEFLWARVGDIAVSEGGDAVYQSCSAIAASGAGHFYTTGVASNGFLRVPRLFVEKRDLSGDRVWLHQPERPSRGDGYSWGQDIAVGPDDAIYVAADIVYLITEYDLVTHPKCTSTHEGLMCTFPKDGVLLRLNPEGSFRWACRMGNTNEDRATSVSVDSGGNAYVGGQFTKSARFGDFGTSNNPAAVVLESSAASNIFVAKYDMQGDLKWARSLPGVIGDLAVDAAANVHVTGSFTGTNLFNTNLVSAGSSDVFVAKLRTTAPPLALLPNSNSVFLSWSVLADDFVLETAAGLTGAWSPIPNGPGGTNYFVEQPLTAGERFFRLKR